MRPLLVFKHTVAAVDLRGAGHWDSPQGGFDKATLAADVHGMLNLAISLDGGGVKESAATVPKEPRAIPMQPIR